jgi:hypothetical protein
MKGSVIVNKVPGNFHFSVHHYPNVAKKAFQTSMPLDFTHYIETLTFGNEKQMQIMTKKFDENFSSQVHGSEVI